MIFDDPSFCILTWSGMNKLEGQVTVHLAAHATEDELDLDAVADHHPEEVVLVAGLRQTGGREVGLVRDLGAWVNILQSNWIRFFKPKNLNYSLPILIPILAKY